MIDAGSSNFTCHVKETSCDLRVNNFVVIQEARGAIALNLIGKTSIEPPMRRLHIEQK